MADRFTTRLAAFVIVYNDKRGVLLQQRAPNSYLGGYWDFPSGHGEHGESIRDSAVRELAEEMGLVGRAEDLRLIHLDQYFLEQDYINFVFVLDTWSGTPKICEPESCSAIGWFALDALPEKCVNAVRAVEHAGFGPELTYSVTNMAGYEAIMGEPFTEKAK
jgi:8-oxo-dGTP diphosphatase